MCGGARRRSGRRCGAAVWIWLREGCTDSADISVAVRGAADGLCGPGVVSFVLARDEALEEPDAVAPAVLGCAPSAARRARPVGGTIAGIGVRYVRGLFVCRWCSAAADICGLVARLARLGCGCRQLGRSTVELLRAACGSGVGAPPTFWPPAATAVSKRRLDRRGPARGGRTAGVGSVVDCMGAPLRGVV